MVRSLVIDGRVLFGADRSTHFAEGPASKAPACLFWMPGIILPSQFFGIDADACRYHAKTRVLDSRNRAAPMARMDWLWEPKPSRWAHLRYGVAVLPGLPPRRNGPVTRSAAARDPVDGV